MTTSHTVPTSRRCWCTSAGAGAVSARRLLLAAEAEALARGRTVLVLDTVPGSNAERLYQRLGWQAAGIIPDFALFPDGRMTATCFYYRLLG